MTVVFFVAVELVLAALGVRPRSWEEDPYVGFSSHSPLFVDKRQPDGSVVMETAANKLRLFNQQSFPRDKGPGVFRVFCVGGSTTYGRPYGDRTSFCGWLRELLPVADPSRSWQVINAGGISYASYRVSVLLEELAGYDPDLFIIYSGHNEFLERRTYAQIIELPPAVRGLGALLSRTRTATLIEATVDGLRQRGGGEQPSATVLDDEVTTLLDDAVGPDAYTRDDELRDQILGHYRFNLARMIDIARSSGARVVLITPAANLRHFEPFKSEHRAGLSEADQRRFAELVEQARTALVEDRADEALSVLDQAVAIDERHAQTQFLRAQVLDQLGRHAEARAAYERARDEDVCPLRALGPMPAMAAATATERGVPVVDFAAMVDARSENGIPGKNLFFDHVHPTIEGNRILALALIDELVEEGIVHTAPGWSDRAVADVVQRVEQGLDPRAHALALKNLSKVLGWAGKLEEARRLALEAVELAPDNAKVQYQAGLCAQLLGLGDEAISHYQRALQANPVAALPHGNLGAALEAEGRIDEAVIHYRRAFELAPEVARNRTNLTRTLLKLGFVTYSHGRLRESLECLSEAARVDPANPTVLDRLGLVRLAASQVDPAVEAFRAAVALAPHNAAIHNRLAVALMLAGDADGSYRHYRHALELDPGLASSPENLVNTLRQLGRTEEADRAQRALASGG